MSSFSCNKLDKLENEMIISKENKYIALTAETKNESFILGMLHAKFGRAYLASSYPSLVVYGDDQQKVKNMKAIERTLNFNSAELGVEL